MKSILTESKKVLYTIQMYFSCTCHMFTPYNDQSKGNIVKDYYNAGFDVENVCMLSP